MAFFILGKYQKKLFSLLSCYYFFTHIETAFLRLLTIEIVVNQLKIETPGQTFSHFRTKIIGLFI